MSHLRDVRRTAAARTIGERHPWAVLYGAKAVGTVLVLGLVVVLAGLLLRAWHAVSGWWSSPAPQGHAVPAAVSTPVPHGIVSAVPWWGWAVLVLVVLVLIRYAPRIVYRLRWGFWPV